MSVEGELVIRLDAPIDELGAEAGDVLFIRPGHETEYALYRPIPPERMARAAPKLTRYLPGALRPDVIQPPRSPRAGGRLRAQQQAPLRLLRVDD